MKKIAILLLALNIIIPTIVMAQDDPTLRMSLSRVVLYAKTGRQDEAFALIQEVKKRYPDNAEVLMAEADLALQNGNRGGGFASLSKAMILDPGNEDIIDRQRQALLENGPFASAGMNFRSTDQADEFISRVAGQTILTRELSASILVENNQLESDEPIVRVDGSSSDFEGDRQRATISLAKLYEYGDEVNASLYIGNETVGAGGLYRWWDRKGATTIQVNVQQPNWDYVESVIGNGTVDNIRVSRKQIFMKDFDGNIELGVNRYNLEDESDMANSINADFNIGYTYAYEISDETEDDIIMGIYYSFDAEYFNDVEEITTTSGIVKPLPAESYEVHSFNISAAKDIGMDLNLEAFAGYAIDRLGDDGPQFGGAVAYAPRAGLGAELRASRGIMGKRDSEVDQVMFNIKWRW